MWRARTKSDLIIEVWEKLDCESIGAAEIEAIEVVVREEYGKGAVDSPMAIARLLADEGAELRHAEIMELYVARASDRPYDAAFRAILDLSDLDTALGSIRQLENLRRKYSRDGDREGLRHVRETGIRAKELAVETSERERLDPATRQVGHEIASWFTVWLQTPEVFETWVDLRKRAPEFIERFGSDKER
ncbi:MAG: hypothetical protein AB7J13_00365 [Pyrinomonadaceae bacterium]